VGSDDQLEVVEVDWRDIEKPVQQTSGKSYKLVIKREPIPIIILPGIMGTRLRQSGGTQEQIWDPDSKYFMVTTYGTFWATAYKKQRHILGSAGVFDPGFAKVDEADDDHNTDKSFFGKVAGGKPLWPDGAARGWGGVAWRAYGKLIFDLHDRTWPGNVGACFKLPVYAVGYDWRGSVQDAGKYVTDKIRKIKSDNPGCQKVILITHSMGGLVARSACQAGLESDVLAVIHTVQPVTGAPAAYWRMKAGFERGHGDTFFDRMMSYPAAWVLGADGLEVTALLGHMPGGLEMLPNMTHQDNTNHPGWLVYVPPDGSAPIRVPRTGDPYGEIYRNETDPWRLVLWKEYLAGYKGAKAPEIGSAWSDFLKCIGGAETVHRGLGVYQHPKSWHFYGVGRPTVDTITITASTIDDDFTMIDPLMGVWKGSPLPPVLERGEFSYPAAAGDGTATFYQMSNPDGDGDSTVARSSGSILTTGGAPGIPVPNSGHDSCFGDNDLVASPDLQNNISNIIQGICLDKIKAEIH
jgi:PGAP1-like protein